MKTNSNPSIRGMITTAAFLLITLHTKSQHLFFERGNSRVEVGFNFGPTFFLGDLGGNRGVGTKFIKDINLDMTRMMKSAYVSFYPSEVFGLRVAGTFTYLAASDDQIRTESGREVSRKMRNLDFRTSVWEVYSALEFYPSELLNNFLRKDIPARLQPYVFAGVGIFHFDPEGSLSTDGKKEWFKLRELMTEGQGMEEYPDRKPYKLTQINIPMGFGVRYIVNEGINTSLECNYRQTFTDYIDDVSTNYIDPNLFDKYLSPEKAEIAKRINNKSLMGGYGPSTRYQVESQRGNPKNTDAYFSFSFKLGVNLSTIIKGGSRNSYYSKRQMRCPVN